MQLLPIPMATIKKYKKRPYGIETDKLLSTAINATTHISKRSPTYAWYPFFLPFV